MLHSLLTSLKNSGIFQAPTLQLPQLQMPQPMQGQQGQQGQNPLDQLRDIHLPNAITGWPPAPGWWILGLVIIVTVGITATLLIKRHQKRRFRRQAINELERIRALNLDNVTYIEALSQLIKRTLVASGTPQGKSQAQLSGDDLTALLSPELKEEHIHWLQQGKYQPASQAPDAQAMADAVKQWIRRHKL